MLNALKIEQGRSAYENTGQRLETEFLGNVNKSKYNELAYHHLHPVEETLSKEQRFEKTLKIREEAQAAFEDTLALAEKNKYIDFKTSMSLVEKCQVGNPENPGSFFIRALHNNIKDRFVDKYILRFFSATGGTHLDVVHGIDGFFKLYDKASGEELTYATIDITGNELKNKAKANVLLNISPAEKDKFDPSQKNQNFDQAFFDKKIAEYSQTIIDSLIDNYIK